MSDWQALGQVQYARRKIYDMEWEDEVKDLQGFIIAASSFGGPLALLRDESKLIMIGDAKKLAPTLQIFSPCGRKIGEVPWTGKRICDKGGLAWTSDEHLVCVLENGTVLVYDMFGNMINSFPILPPNSKNTVVRVEVFSTELVALDSAMNVLYVTGIGDGQPRRMKLASKVFSTDQPPTSMAVLQPRFTSSGNVEVLFGTKEASIVVVDPESTEDQHLEGKMRAPIIAMAVAPKGSFMACFSSDGLLTVVSTNFSKKVLEFDTQSGAAPMYMVWCGEDSILLYWKQLGILMVGPFGNWHKYRYPRTIFLTHEPDCARIYSPIASEIIQRVPVSIEAVRSIGSTDPAAMLYDALDAFDSGDPKADENLRSIIQTGQLSDAVSTCIDAAGAEMDPTKQQEMLRAASYGKVFCEGFDPDIFLDTCKMIRVLNAVKERKIAMPITAAEYQLLTPEVVVSRLVNRKHHFLAIKFCEYLGIKKDRVLVHWACEKVKAAKGLTDDALLRTVREKLRSCQEVSYAEIASCAEQVGRKKLATMLLDYEPKTSNQIPLLLSMGEHKMALRKAIASQDVDNIYLVLLHAQKTMNPSGFYGLLVEPGTDMATDLLVSYYNQDPSEEGEQQLMELYGHFGHLNESGNTAVRRAAAASDYNAVLRRWTAAQAYYQQARSLPNSKAAEESKELLMEQKRLAEKTSDQTYLYLSLYSTIKKLIKDSEKDNRLAQAAAMLAKKFRVPEKSYYIMKIRALADSKQWKELERFAGEKRSPVGYKPFAQAAAQNGKPALAEKFCSKIANHNERFDAFESIGMWSQAAEIAIKLRDAEKMTIVKRQAKNDPRTVAMIDDAARQFGM